MQEALSFFNDIEAIDTSEPPLDRESTPRNHGPHFDYRYKRPYYKEDERRSGPERVQQIQFRQHKNYQSRWEPHRPPFRDRSKVMTIGYEALIREETGTAGIRMEDHH